MPRVPAEEHRLAGFCHPDLAGLGVCEDQRAAEHEIGDIGAEHSSMRVRVEALPPGGSANTNMWIRSVEA